ncbi:MAG: rRNA maturation RNase YbeY [Phycisphaerales bacterium]
MNQRSTKIDSTRESAGDSDDSGPSSSFETDQPPERSAELEADQHVGDVDQAGETALTVNAAAGLDGRIDTQWVRDHLQEALAHIDGSVHRIAVMLVDDDQMSRLHEAHRGEDNTTDVLTFQTSRVGDPIEADVAVSVDEAARRAPRLEHTIEREVLLYTLHGILHCAGFDDRTEEQSRAMHAEEDRILEAIGVGATFARDLSGHDDDRAAISRDRGSAS